MEEESVSYKQIVRTTGIYGSSQLVNIIIGIVRSKLTALLLGAVGIGMIGLLQSVVDLIRSAAGLGLDMGATKKIAVADTLSTSDLPKTLYTVSVWYFVSAILGALLCLVFSDPLSVWAFGSSDYKIHISTLAVAIFFTVLTAGVTSSLQGLRKITYMALASSAGSIISLIVVIPIYYYWRLDGVIWGFVVSNIIVFFVSLFFYGRVKIRYEKVSLIKVWRDGRGMVRLGIYIVLAGVLSAVSLLLVRSYIGRDEGVEDVGLFQAAWLTSFLISGIILRSVNSDFFPKLCSLINNKSDVKRFVNEQTYIILLITSPLIIGLFTFSEYVIRFLYTSEFLASVHAFRWHIVAIFLKMVSTPVAMVILAGHRGRLHLLCESLFWGVYLLSGYFLYSFFVLEGTGMAYLAAYIVYVPTVLVAGGRIADVMWNRSVLGIFFLNIVLLGFLLFVSEFYGRYTLSGGIVLLAVTLSASLYRIKSLVGLKGGIRNWMKGKVK